MIRPSIPVSWAAESGRMRKLRRRVSEERSSTTASARASPSPALSAPLHDPRVGPSQGHRRQVAIQIRNTVGDGLVVGMSDDFDDVDVERLRDL